MAELGDLAKSPKAEKVKKVKKPKQEKVGVKTSAEVNAWLDKALELARKVHNDLTKDKANHVLTNLCGNISAIQDKEMPKAKLFKELTGILNGIEKLPAIMQKSVAQKVPKEFFLADKIAVSSSVREPNPVLPVLASLQEVHNGLRTQLVEEGYEQFARKEPRDIEIPNRWILGVSGLTGVAALLLTLPTMKLNKIAKNSDLPKDIVAKELHVNLDGETGEVDISWMNKVSGKRTNIHSGNFGINDGLKKEVVALEMVSKTEFAAREAKNSPANKFGVATAFCALAAFVGACFVREHYTLRFDSKFDKIDNKLLRPANDVPARHLAQYLAEKSPEGKDEGRS